MQAPPPVSNLLQQYATMAFNVRNVLRGTDVDWRWRPSDGEWSLTEVLSHLRDVEREVHQQRFKILIENETPFISGVSADEWADERGYRYQNGPNAMQSFLQARDETLSMLAHLDDKTWARLGQHAFFGPTSTHELLFLAVRHDEIHWEQIKNLLAGKRADRAD